MVVTINIKLELHSRARVSITSQSRPNLPLLSGKQTLDGINALLLLDVNEGLSCVHRALGIRIIYLCPLDSGLHAVPLAHLSSG